MIKILIIENEYHWIRIAFEYINEVYFNNTIEYTNIVKSQDIRNLKDLEEYDYIFLDISLSIKSKLDGFGILQKIEDEKLSIKNLIILTGNHSIEEKLNERGLSTKYPILTKPIDFKDLLKIIKA